jgi:hypothetical protein
MPSAPAERSPAPGCRTPADLPVETGSRLRQGLVCLHLNARTSTMNRSMFAPASRPATRDRPAPQVHRDGEQCWSVLGSEHTQPGREHRRRLERKSRRLLSWPSARRRSNNSRDALPLVATMKASPSTDSTMVPIALSRIPHTDALGYPPTRLPNPGRVGAR